MKIPTNDFAISFLRSFAQIMLQRNAATGLLFIIGIGLNSPSMLLGGTIATLSALFIASHFNYDTDAIHDGLYGYNAALVGIAVFYFLTPSLWSVALAICGGVLATVIMHCFRLKLPRIAALTAPFVLSTWAVLMMVDFAGITRATMPFATLPISTLPFSNSALNDFYTIARGVAQVLFQDYWLSGVIFIAGLLLHSTKVAIWAVIGSGIGMLVASLFNFNETLVLLGSYSFSACLVAIALAGHYEKKPWLILLGSILLGTVCCVILTRIFEQIALPSLTAPFVIATWFIFALVRIAPNIKNRDHLTSAQDKN